MKTIDFHIHTFPDLVAPKALPRLQKMCGVIPCTDGTVSSTLRRMEESGIDMGVSLNIATSPKQQETINTSASKIEEATSGKLIGFGSVHPSHPDALKELERIHALGIKGIKFHPDYQGFFVDEERMFPIYEKCGKLGLIVVFHAGWDYYSPDLVHANPKAERDIARRFPQTRFVFAHLGGLNRWDEAEQFLVGEPNVYLDTSLAASFTPRDQAQRIIENHLEDNILLGSDCPWEDPKKSREFIESLELSQQRKEKILSLNASRLLGLC